MKILLVIASAAFFFFSCSSLMNYKPAKDEFKNVEFEKKVTIVEAATDEQKPPATDASVTVKKEVLNQNIPTDSVQGSSKTDKSQEKKAVTVGGSEKKPAKSGDKPVKGKEIVPAKDAKALPKLRQPDIEDREGFDNSRRPSADPFRVGEVVEHEVGYLGATAGTLKFMVKPFANVNGKKSYNFFIDLHSTTFFSRVYAVDDKVQTFVDYEELVPHVFKLNIRDSGQVKEAQSYFDNVNLKADYWEHRYTEKNGHEEKKLSWSILPYSQNPFSAVFYMRVFKWVIGKEYSFRVADDEKNVIFRGRAIEKTVLNTEAGKFNAIKIKAEVYSRGNLAKATDFYMWISDDDRKFILRIEVKLPIGSLVSEVVDIEKGKP